MSLRFRHLFFPPTLEETRAILNSPTPETDFTKALDDGLTYLIVVDNILRGKSLAIHTVKYLLAELREKKRVESTFYWRFTNMIMRTSRAVGLIKPLPPPERHSFSIKDEPSYTDTSVSTRPTDDTGDQGGNHGLGDDPATPDLYTASDEAEFTSPTSLSEPEEMFTPPSIVPIAAYGYIDSAQSSQKMYEPIGTLAEMLRAMELEEDDDCHMGKRKRHDGETTKTQDVTHIDGVPISIIRANEHLARAMETRRIAGPKRLASKMASGCHTPAGRDEIQDASEENEESESEESEEDSDDEDVTILMC